MPVLYLDTSALLNRYIVETRCKDRIVYLSQAMIGALNTAQNEAVCQLRAGMVALAEREQAAQVVNVHSPAQECPIGESSQTKIVYNPGTHTRR